MQVFVFLFLIASAASHVCYVKPNNSSSCPDQPCMTIDQYTSDYFVPGSTFLFLAGSHTINSTIYLRNVSDIVFKGDENGSHVIIRCNTEFSAIKCDNIVNLRIKGIEFLFYTGDTVIDIFNSKKVFLHNLIFHAADAAARAANFNHSEVVITYCHFEGGTGLNGGAVLLLKSNITLQGNAFINNKARQSGGAVFANRSSLFLNNSVGNLFVNNSAGNSGGALFLLKSNITMECGGANVDFNCSGFKDEYAWQYEANSAVYFLNNRAVYFGGAIFFSSSSAFLCANTAIIFYKNSALRGGAIESNNSKVTTTIWYLCFIENSAENYGGAYFGDKGALNLSGIEASVHFENNSANNGGGGISFLSGLVHISARQATFMYNHALNDSGSGGGGILISDTRVVFGAHAIEFISNTAHNGSGGGMVFLRSKVLITTAIIKFINNTSQKDGGGIILEDSELNISLSIFCAKKAALRNNHALNNSEYRGGGTSSTPDIFSDYAIEFVSNAAHNGSGGGIAISRSKVLITTAILRFINNTCQRNGGGMAVSEDSEMKVSVSVCAIRAVLQNNHALNDSEHRGGETSSSPDTFSDNAIEFVSNAAHNGSGGGMEISGSKVLIIAATLRFINNTCQGNGGGAVVTMSELNISDSVCAKQWNNHALNDSDYRSGETSSKTDTVFSDHVIEFVSNAAHNESGGGMAIFRSKVLITTALLSFINNTCKTNGGGIKVASISELNITKGLQLNFSCNRAGWGGGLMCISSHCTIHSPANYANNTASLVGGAIAAIEASLFHHNDINITGNSDIAIDLVEAGLSFIGVVRICKNTGRIGAFSFDIGGGGIRAIDSTITFEGNATFEDNYATTNGGAISLLLRSTFHLNGIVQFRNNSARKNGGAIFATDSKIYLKSEVKFELNTAEKGGAMYLQNKATVVLRLNTTIQTSSNYASKYGGAIFYSDAVTPSQCSVSNTDIAPLSLPSCFIDVTLPKSNFPFSISSINDSAGLAGGFLYGGLLDKCEVIKNYNTDLNKYYFQLGIFYEEIFLNINITTIQSKSGTEIGTISSEPYKLCFCETSGKYNCSAVSTVETYRGRTLTVSLVALAQGNSLSLSSIRAKLSPTARLKTNQISQRLPQKCTNISYNLYSSANNESMILYLDGGPCRDIGAARKKLIVIFKPCPHAFSLSGDTCVCEKRLKQYNTECTIFDEKIYIMRKAGSRFWMSPLLDLNGTYEGLILYPSCPNCKQGPLNISLFQPDFQCKSNQSGMLCGACAANHSLVLGGSECRRCSSSYLTLLLPFAAAGIALVVFLTALRLTVATGLINGVILYANILQANGDLLYPSSTKTSVLTIFIAWLNLDLGFHTCFYDGMDAYAQTWLQFVFPIYVWVLITLIIVLSRRFAFVTKLIGSDPLAVLATLILMSYSKILTIIIEVYSSARLEYPDNKTVTVWLKDANVPYLQSWHLALTVVTTLVLVLFFFPYTLLLLTGYQLYRFTWPRKTSRWFIRIKLLLDSYYAPFQMHTRFWPGFLLLVRCVLYIIFSYDALEDTRRSLLAINITFAVVIACLSVKVYSSFYTNAIEASLYMNLIVLSAASSNDVNSPALANSLVAIVFAMVVVASLYQFHVIYMANKSIMKKMFSKLKKTATSSEEKPLLAPVSNTLHTPTSSVVSIHDQ